MSDPGQQEMQHELFEEFSKETKRADRIPQLSRAQKPILFNTTLEQLLLGSILLILAFCLVFFLGVIRGKSLNAPLPVPIALKPVLLASRAPQKAVPVREARLAVSPVPLAVPTPISQASTAPLRNSSSATPYTIQLVTHKKKETAENEVAALTRGGFYGFIMTSGEYYLVCAGRYASKEDAKKDLHTFSARYKDCFLRRR